MPKNGVLPNIPVQGPGDPTHQFPVPVTILSGGGAGGTSATDQAPFTAGSSSGTPLMAEDPTSGELLIAQMSPGTRQLLVAANVTVTPVQSNALTAITSPATIGTTPVTAIAANASRKRLLLHNVGTTVFFILFGAGTPSNSNFHIALRAGGTADDGSSEPYLDTMWTGAVQAVSSGAGGSLAIAEFI